MLLRRLLPLAAAIVLFVVFAPTQIGGNTTYVMVNGKSMLPLVTSGSLALVREHPHYEVGDVVAYRYPGLGVVIHRIVKADADGTFTLKGDNNAWLDGHHPRSDEILGKLWLHTKRLGAVAKNLQSPGNAAILVGVVGTGMVATDSSKREKRGRRGGRLDPPGGRRRSRAPSQALETALLVSLALLLASGALALFARRHPTTTTRDKLTTFGQQATFSYAAEVPPGIYDTSSLQGGDPVFPGVTPRITIDAQFELTADVPVIAEGTYRMVARLEHPNTGWKRSFELTPPTQFTEPQFSATGTLDLAPIVAATRTLEDVATLQPGQAFELSAGLEVTSKGRIGLSPFETVYEPKLDFVLDSHALVLETDAGDDSPLTASTTSATSSRVSEPNEVRVLWFDAEVDRLRLVSLAAVGATATVAAALWLTLSRRRRDPVMSVETRYARFLVDVQGGKLAPETPRVQVMGVEDLAKVAEQEGRMILHEAGSRDHRYFVLGDEVVYYYRLPLDGVLE